MKSQIDLNKYDSEQRCAALISHYENIEDRPKNHRAFWRDLSTFWPTFDNIDHDAIQNLMLNTLYRHAYLTKLRYLPVRSGSQQQSAQAAEFQGRPAVEDLSGDH